MKQETKEIKNIRSDIKKWAKKHKGKVAFTGSFMAFEGKNIVDSLIIGYGSKEFIEVYLEELNKKMKKEKKDFVNYINI